MFHKRTRGLTGLEPLTGREQPVQTDQALLWRKHHVGDLQDIRNRLGLLAPPSTRFVEMELCLKRPLDTDRHQVLMDLMRSECHRNSQINRSYYTDPYGRDRPGGAMQMMLEHRKAADRADKDSPAKPKGKGDNVTPRMKCLQDAMNEAKERREEQRQKDAQLWGGAAQEEFYVATRPQGEAPKVSPHLYQPRNPKPKSEWSKNMEVAMALSRKKDQHQANRRRLEQRALHGDDVRINRGVMDAEALEKLVGRMREKDERIAKFVKSKVKYQ